MCSCFRDRLVCSESGLGSGCATIDGFNRAQAPLGAGEAFMATCSTAIITLWGVAAWTFRDEAASWWRTMFGAILQSNPADNASPLGSAELHAANPDDRDLQRARGSCQIVVSGSEKGTRIEDVFQRSPIRVLFPRVGGAPIEEAVLVNTAGGIAGGDQLESCVTVLAGASIAITSQAAEKVYRALREPARVVTKLEAHETARLAWLPQETIVFNWARLSRDTEIDLSSGCELLALEWLLLGRAAHGEEVVGGHITDTWRVKKDGRLIWADTFRATDEIFPYLHGKALLADYKAVATLLYFGPALDKRLEFLRALIPSLQCQCAATSVSGLIVVRFAAKASSDLRLALRSLLRQFGQELGPGPFRVPKMWSC
jgi:urease accessory protein